MFMNLFSHSLDSRKMEEKGLVNLTLTSHTKNMMKAACNLFDKFEQVDE